MAIATGNRMNAAVARSTAAAATAGARCTWFLPGAEPRSARKRWIAGARQPGRHADRRRRRGRARSRGGKSLLPAGIVAVEGDFERGDCVVVRARDGRETGARPVGLRGRRHPAIAGHKSE